MHFSIKNYWLFAQKNPCLPICSGKISQKNTLECTSRKVDLPLCIAEFRCRDACDKNQMEETKAENKDPENGAWCHVNDGILDEFSGWVGVVVACWRVEQIIKYCQLIYISILMCFMLKVFPVHCKFMNIYMFFLWVVRDLDRGWHFLDASQKPLHDFSVGTFTPLHPLHLKKT